MTSWDDLRVFLAVHRQRSHAGAARHLRIDPTTVGRRISALEAALGARLFARTQAGLAPTPAAAVLAARAERIEAEMLAAERELGGADERLEGVVRITASEGVMALILVPGLAALRSEHPGIRVELVAESRALDLVRGEADVAIRLFRPRETSLVARRIGTLTYGIYGAESYLARRSRPRALRDLAAHDWIGYASTLERARHSVWLREHVPRSRWVVTVNLTSTALAACAAGHGLTILALPFGDSDPRLARVLPRVALPELEAWAVSHQDLRRSAKVGAVLRWISSLFDHPGELRRARSEESEQGGFDADVLSAPSPRRSAPTIRGEPGRAP